MTLRRTFNLAILLSVLVALLIGCGGPTPLPPVKPGGSTNTTSNNPVPLATAEKITVEVAPGEPQILVLEPEDAEVTRSPFFLRVSVANFTIPLNSVSIHIAVDAQCIQAGNPIPEDAQHISLPTGTFEDSRFNLPLGQHRLCIQAANRDNIALEGAGMLRVIDVTIDSVRQPNDD
ncbi:MAG TPA: DUF4399 domain-containing protein [Anaerolineae bacterium]|nr:DUF4399 domain-containing protein [Anaerolineae bacterium]